MKDIFLLGDKICGVFFNNFILNIKLVSLEGKSKMVDLGIEDLYFRFFLSKKEVVGLF